LIASGNLTANTVTSTNSVFAGNVSQVSSNAFPFFQIYNSAGPTDKKYIRTTLGTTGVFGLERVNDAYSSATYILYADANNVINTNANPITNCPTTAKAYCYVTTTGVLTNGFGVLSCARTSLGNFTITLINGIDPAFPLATTSVVGFGAISIVETSATTYVVRTADSQGAASDRAFYFAMFGS